MTATRSEGQTTRRTEVWRGARTATTHLIDRVRTRRRGRSGKGKLGIATAVMIETIVRQTKARAAQSGQRRRR
eukprot:1590794-Rhodomonas_salina.1